MTDWSIDPPTTRAALAELPPEKRRVLLRFISYIRPHWHRIGLGLLLALLGTAGALATPWVAKVVIDHIINSEPIARTVCLLALIMLGTSVLDFAQSVVLGTTAEKIVYQSRVDLVGVLLRAPVRQLANRRVGELVTRATSDTTLLRDASSISLVGIVNAGIMCVGIVVLMYVLDPTLLVVTALALLISAVILWSVIPMVTAAQYRVQKSLGHFGGALGATLAAIRTVKAAQAEEQQAASIDAAAEHAKRHALLAVKLNAFAWAVMTTATHVGVVVVLAFGAWRLREGSIDVSTLVAFILYATALAQPITALGEHLPQIQSGVAAVKRMDELLVIAPEDTEPVAKPGGPQPARDASLLEFRSVSFRHQEAGRSILSDVNFALSGRGHYAIIGESGVGKSTLLSLVMAFIRPDSGAIYLDGSPYEDMSIRSVRQSISYVEQDCPIIAGTIRQNLLLGDVDATDEEISHVLDRLRLSELIEGCEGGLDALISDSTVSAGQRQRLAIARGILRPSRILILDEPTAHLDAAAESAVIECLRSTAERRAVLTVSHRESTVASADVVLMLKSGVLSECRSKGGMVLPAGDQLISPQDEGLLSTKL